MRKTLLKIAAAAGMVVTVGLLYLPGEWVLANDTFAAGDLFVSLKTGEVQWRHADGSFNRTMVGFVPGHAEGMGFDPQMNLYVAHWCAGFGCLMGNSVEKFGPNGMVIGPFGSGYNCNPSGIVFDSSGNAYVGQADCTADILKFNTLGMSAGSFNAAVENRGTDWVDIDGTGCVIYYTSRSRNILRYNVCADQQTFNFNNALLPGGEAYALRILPDGGVLVANTAVIARLNSTGDLVQTYDVPGEPDLWLGLDIVGDGTFWTSNFLSSNVFRIDLATGAVITSFNTGTPTGTVKGVAVKRAPTLVMKGRMTGGGSVFTDSGMRVTHGFELRCDQTQEPNNLEVNWHPSGTASSRFHMDELTFAQCHDDPSFEPIPPKAPFDTYRGAGTGRYNGQDGATAEWTFTDEGEPGTRDRIVTMTIRDAGGNVVLVVNNKQLTKGNHQAHK